MAAESPSPTSCCPRYSSPATSFNVAKPTTTTAPVGRPAVTFIFVLVIEVRGLPFHPTVLDHFVDISYTYLIGVTSFCLMAYV